MRSGSTVLKALLGTANDVSHLNEYDFQRNVNRYLAYYHVYHLSESPIIILKKPSYYDDYLNYPKLPKYNHKIIILIRNPHQTIASIQKIKDNIPKKSIDYLGKYWLQTYHNLSKLLDKNNVFLVQYEQLTNQPIAITKQLFSFINSTKKEGTNTYNLPENGWKWGIDDGGKRIQSLKIQPKNTTSSIDFSTEVNKLIMEIEKRYKINFYE